MINHLNDDLYIFLKIINKNIVVTCGLQIIDYLPQCNDNGKYGHICNVYTVAEKRKQGLQKELLNEVINFAKEFI